MAEGTSAQSTAAGTQSDDVHDKIIAESYGDGNHCDILGKYCWSIDAVRNSDNNDIPFCRLVEYKQIHNSVITNLINSISAASTSVESNAGVLGDGFNKVQEISTAMVSAAAGELSDGTKGAISDAGEAVAEAGQNALGAGADAATAAAETEAGQVAVSFGKGLMSALGKGWEMIQSSMATYKNDLSGHRFLKPYSLLYWLSQTGKQYTFPMLSDLPKQKLTNVFGDNNSDTSIFSANSFLSQISNFASDIPSTVRDLADISRLINGDKPSTNQSFSGAFVEKAKFFQYPQETEEYTVQFPLINTVRTNSGKPEWQKNYKFIMLFSIRNMIFRKDNAEYYPPLFYDLYIPGVVRQPYCYVSSVDVQPMGMVKMKPITGVFSGIESKGTINVPVPELWLVSIKFKSLIPTSANMVLSSIYDLPITAKATTSK